MTGACSLCGAIGPLHQHHPTRRPAPSQTYFDPGFTAPRCAAPCHPVTHAALRAAGLDLLPPGMPPVGYRLRTAAFEVELQLAARGMFTVEGHSGHAFAALLRAAADEFEVTP